MLPNESPTCPGEIRTVLVAGLGLIGGSMAKAIKKNTGCRVLGINRTRAVAERALAEGAIDAIAEEADLAACDLLIPAMPPAATEDPAFYPAFKARLAPYVADVLAEGAADGSFHARHPMELGKLLLLLALDADEEACTTLARQSGNPDALIDMLELMNAWREAAEDLVGAPFGSIRLFDATRLVSSWQASAALLKE